MFVTDRLTGDELQAMLYARGRKAAQLRKRGVCVHGWIETKPTIRCLNCGESFPTRADLDLAIDNAFSRKTE